MCCIQISASIFQHAKIICVSEQTALDIFPLPILFCELFFWGGSGIQGKFLAKPYLNTLKVSNELVFINGIHKGQNSQFDVI
jgi:hypothetical protein